MTSARIEGFVMKAGMAIAVVVSMVFLSPVQALEGCWQASDATMSFAGDGTYAFDGEKGRWMTQGAEVWLLGDANVGTQWRFDVKDDVLVLDQPEDFKYLGSGEYWYFQMTPKDLEYRFKAAAEDKREACVASATQSKSVLSIAELRAEERAAGGVFQITGVVSKRYTCPPCPKGAKCKPCMGNNVVLSIDARTHEDYTTLNDGDVIVFTDAPDLFEMGKTYVVTVKIMDRKQSNRGIHDLKLLKAVEHTP